MHSNNDILYNDILLISLKGASARDIKHMFSLGWITYISSEYLLLKLYFDRISHNR